MKKQGRYFWGLAVVLAVLAASYFFLARYNKDQQEQSLDRVEGEELVNISEEDILRFSYVYDGETCTFIRTEAGWVSEADPALPLIQSRLDTMAGKLTHIVAQSTIEDVTDMSQYGLEEPSNVLSWETDQGVYTYNIGDYNSFGNVYYICEPDSSTVYAVTASLGTGFGYSLEELVEEEVDSAQSAIE